MYAFNTNKFSTNLIYNKKHWTVVDRNISHVPIVLGKLAVDSKDVFDLLEHDVILSFPEKVIFRVSVFFN